MNFDLLAPREQLVAIMTRIYHYGLTTLSGGDLSIPQHAQVSTWRSLLAMVRICEPSQMARSWRGFPPAPC